MKNILFISLFILASFFLTAQENTVSFKAKNLPVYDQKPLHFGFHLGLVGNKIYAQKNDLMPPTSLYTDMGYGFRFGIHGLYRFTSNLVGRVAPNIVFTHFDMQKVHYLTSRNYGESKTFVELPVTLKMNTKRICRNLKPYALFGANMQLDISDRNMRSKYIGSDIALQCGIGMDFFYKYFVQSIEFVYANGLIDHTRYYGYSSEYESVHTHTFSLNFLFN